MRAAVFVRESINTNIHLTTNELKTFYEEANKKLDEQLYVNKKKIRIRNNDNLNVSGIIKEKNYNKHLKATDNNDQENNNENEDENNQINKKNELNIPSTNIPNNLNPSENPMESSKQNLRKSFNKHNENKNEERRVSKNNLMTENITLNKTEMNSDLPLLNKQKTMQMLNLRASNNKEIQNKNLLKFNFHNKTLNKTSNQYQTEKSINIYNSVYQSQYNQTGIVKNSTLNNEKKKIKSFIFKEY